MGLQFKELYEVIRDTAFDTHRAISNTANHGPYIERAKNILYNRMDAIEEALKYAVEAEEKMNVLEVELADAERELDEKEKEIRGLTSQKTTNKKKGSEPANE